MAHKYDFDEIVKSDAQLAAVHAQLAKYRVLASDEAVAVTVKALQVICVVYWPFFFFFLLHF
jgi:hypothetical protein